MTAQPRKLEAETPAVHFTEDELRAMSNDVREIKNAVIGDDRYGQRGLVSRMNTVERALLVGMFFMVAVGGERIISLLF